MNASYLCLCFLNHIDIHIQVTIYAPSYLIKKLLYECQPIHPTFLLSPPPPPSPSPPPPFFIAHPSWHLQLPLSPTPFLLLHICQILITMSSFQALDHHILHICQRCHHCANKDLFGPLNHASNQAFNRTIF